MKRKWRNHIFFQKALKNELSFVLSTLFSSPPLHKLL